MVVAQVQCPECREWYKIGIEPTQPETVRCRNCGHEWVIQPREDNQ